MANISIVFDPPVNKDNLHKLPVQRKKELISFINSVYGRKATEAEILDFLETLNLKDKESKENE